MIIAGLAACGGDPTEDGLATTEDSVRRGAAGIPRPGDRAAYWDADDASEIVDASTGGLYTADGRYKSSHRGREEGAVDWVKSKSVRYSGRKSWRVVCNGSNGRNEQRILRDFDPVSDGARWFSFAVYLEPGSVRTGSHFFFAQLHQSVAAGNPPVFMSWTGSTWELVIRTDAGVRGRNQRRVLASGPMRPGSWYHFKLELAPGLAGTAKIRLWQKESGRWNRKALSWGPIPVDTIGYKYSLDGNIEPWDAFNWKLGMYRGGATTTNVAYFDNVSYGRTEADLQGL